MSDAKVLYLNPVPTQDGVDEIFADMAGRFKAPGTEVHVASLPRASGTYSHLEYYSYGDAVLPWIIRATRQAREEQFDSVVVGCFYDPGLRAAREVSGDTAVVGACEAATDVAVALSNRFGVVVGRTKWIDLMQEVVERHGHAKKLTGFYPVGLGVNDFQADHDRTERLLTEASRRAIEDDGAEAIVLGCTLEVGFYERLQSELAVPVIDAAVSSLKRAEYLARLRRDCAWTPSRAGSCEAPPEDEFLKFTGFGGEEAFGNRLVVPAE